MPVFRIDWEFVGLAMPASERDLRFGGAEKRWAHVITGWPKSGRGKPAMKSLKITVEMADLNKGRKGKDLALGHTDIVACLPDSAGAAAGIPTHARMLLDRKRFGIAIEERPEVVRDLIAHAIGHALGFGAGMACSRFVEAKGRRTFFTGRHAMKEYKAIARGGPVPLESQGDKETAGKHWDENARDRSPLGRIMVYELMSGNFDSGDNRLTRLTIAAMRDLGYDVDMDAAENYRDAD